MVVVIPENITSFINEHNYDVRVSHYGRWMDQKCQANVLCIVADCIVEFVDNNPGKEVFNIRDIWFSKYAVENVQGIFNKPHLKDEKAKHEYDKFFGQPMLLMAYAGVLKNFKIKNQNHFKVVDMDILRFISARERNAIDFLYCYLSKTIQDSGLNPLFERFFTYQDDDSFYELKDGFETFLHTYTPIRGHYEPGRIFAPVVNTLAYKKGKRGSSGGRPSKDTIELVNLMYKGDNFRDVYVNKPRGMTRAEFREQSRTSGSATSGTDANLDCYSAYWVERAKKAVRRYNDRFNDGLSEIREYDPDMSNASYIHHIFPKSQFPEIAHFYENLIALTPNQHWNQAHPLGNTQRISREFQKLLLLCKCETIRINYVEHRDTYDFSKFQIVLDTGLDTDIFEEIDYLDFSSIVRELNNIYTEIDD